MFILIQGKKRRREEEEKRKKQKGEEMYCVLMLLIVCACCVNACALLRFAPFHVTQETRKHVLFAPSTHFFVIYILFRWMISGNGKESNKRSRGREVVFNIIWVCLSFFFVSFPFSSSLILSMKTKMIVRWNNFQNIKKIFKK